MNITVQMADHLIFLGGYHVLTRFNEIYSTLLEQDVFLFSRQFSMFKVRISIFYLSEPDYFDIFFLIFIVISPKKEK